MTEKGKFIVIEGADGAGTTTQAKLLADRLSPKDELCGNDGVFSMFTREPTDGTVGEMIRERILSGNYGSVSNEVLMLLFRADRMDHCDKIRPYLDGGVHVICDRYYPSTLVYQTLGEHDVHKEMLAMFDMFRYSDNILPPDLIVYLDVDLDERMERISSRGEPMEIFDEADKQEMIQRSYNTWFYSKFGYDQLYSGSRVCRVNGNASVEEVAIDIAKIVGEWCNIPKLTDTPIFCSETEKLRDAE